MSISKARETYKANRLLSYMIHKLRRSLEQIVEHDDSRADLLWGVLVDYTGSELLLEHAALVFE